MNLPWMDSTVQRVLQEREEKHQILVSEKDKTIARLEKQLTATEKRAESERARAEIAINHMLKNRPGEIPVTASFTPNDDRMTLPMIFKEMEKIGMDLQDEVKTEKTVLTGVGENGQGSEVRADASDI